MMIFKEQFFDEQTQSYIYTDNRVFEHCKTFQIQEIKKLATERILELAPEHKQRNAALGLLTQQETDAIKTTIQTIRDAVNSAEQQILSVVWNGTEQTRAAACDAVQAVRCE
jgi:hypothetical protein